MTRDEFTEYLRRLEASAAAADERARERMAGKLTAARDLRGSIPGTKSVADFMTELRGPRAGDD